MLHSPLNVSDSKIEVSKHVQKIWFENRVYFLVSNASFRVYSCLFVSKSEAVSKRVSKKMAFRVYSCLFVSIRVYSCLFVSISPCLFVCIRVYFCSAELFAFVRRKHWLCTRCLRSKHPDDGPHIEML